MIESACLRTQLSRDSILALFVIYLCSNCLIRSSKSSTNSCWTIMLIMPFKRRLLTTFGSNFTPWDSFSLISTNLSISICYWTFYPFQLVPAWLLCFPGLRRDMTSAETIPKVSSTSHLLNTLIAEQPNDTKTIDNYWADLSSYNFFVGR